MPSVDDTNERDALEGDARILFVPRTPGSLIDPDELLRPRPRDEIDEAIDDLFGPDSLESPGKLDIGLLAVGLGLVLWAQLAGRSTGFTVLGAILALLGSVLPMRGAWRYADRRRMRRRRAKLSSEGLPLDVGSPLTHDLVDAYDALLEVVKQPGIPFRLEALHAALLAVFETAALLGGNTPSTASEKRYVEERTTAIRKLTQTLEQQLFEAESALQVERQADAQLDREARRRAGAELDAGGQSSLSDLRDLTKLLS